MITEKENLQNIFDKSKSKIEVLRMLGYKSKGSNYKTLEKLIKKHEIILDKFNENVANRNGNNKTVPNNEIFISNSKYRNNSEIKKRLLNFELCSSVA